jgi:hypothetical protein
MTAAILAPAPLNDGDWPPCPFWCTNDQTDDDALGRVHEGILTSFLTRAHELAEPVAVSLVVDRCDELGIEGHTRVVLRLNDEDARLSRAQRIALVIALLGADGVNDETTPVAV